jgi:hypothetical protein
MEAGDHGDSRHCRWSRPRNRPSTEDPCQTAYLQDVAGKPSTAEEPRKLAALRDEGAISTADYEQAKAKALD